MQVGRVADGGHGRDGRRRSWTLVPWAIAAILWLSPLVAMRFTDAVAWDAADFALFGAMLGGACGVLQLAAATSGSVAYRAALFILVAAAVFLAWVTLAVGIVGSEDDPANLMYGGVLAVVLTGGLLARLQARGMVRASIATACAQLLAGTFALAAGWGAGTPHGSAVVCVLTGLFTGLWLLSAGLFRKAAQAGAGR